MEHQIFLQRCSQSYIYAGDCTIESIYYDTYYGKQMSIEDVLSADILKKAWCIADIQPCDPNEGRRIDGSCNNLDHPQRGTAHTPFKRILPPVYSAGYEPRLSQSGKPLPLARRVRTTILAQGIRPNPNFTHLATSFFVTMTEDFVPARESADQVTDHPFCCTPLGKLDTLCSPQEIPDDDPVHRFSGIRCMNLTKPISYQYRRCIKMGSIPERITTSTPLFDLSEIYGNSAAIEVTPLARLYSRGMLKSDVDGGREYPPTMPTIPNICLLNQPPHETRCHATPDEGSNSVLGLNLFVIWLWRNHNRIASTLADLNPCWDDEKLFETARDINIASTVQILYYEFLPLLLGRENLLKDSVISSDSGFRNNYNKSIIPQISLEFPYILRWTHLMQEGRIKMFDGSGNYLKQIPVTNLTTRTGYLAVDNNLDYITQGAFRQASGKNDHVLDPIMAEFVTGPYQKASDIGTFDLARGRYFGFPPYVKYREYCSGYLPQCFEDLSDIIDDDSLELLQDLYDSVDDIDLMAGVWVEKPIEGGVAPQTFYCLVVEQLLRSMKSDRFWYESQHRPNAFTLDQLLEIRKATISGFLCEVGDKVTDIQRHGFLRIGLRNKMVSCDKIEKINLTVWKDNTCVHDSHPSLKLGSLLSL